MHAPLPQPSSRRPRRFPVLLLSLIGLATAAPAEPWSLQSPYPLVGRVETADPADLRLDTLVELQARFELVADGFRWSEGPVWLPKEQALVFSDVPANVAYRWNEKAGLTRFLAPSGYTGPSEDKPRQGSNGIKRGADNRLLLCQHGDRRVVRLEESGAFTTLADRFEGRRFNSPNDLAITRNGSIFFTDPPYGLNDPAKERELDHCGVYRLSADGTVSLVTRELAFPNGIALSPDDRTLYVTSSDPKNPIVLAVPLDAEAHPAGASRVFFDASPLCSKLGIDRPMDGVAVDEQGNLWATGPGGVLVINQQGSYLGTLFTGRDTANCAFGGPDGRTLFVTAANTLMRIRTKVRGHFHP
jgi:gluconolactonase